jgi:putative inorganic carbon (HCO3(-)) transporter
LETQSVVIGKLYIIAGYLLAAFKSSVVYRILIRIVKWARWIFGSCVLLEIIEREGRIEGFWKPSKTYRFFASVLQNTMDLTKRLYDKRRGIFAHSSIFKLLIYFADSLHVLLSLALFVMVITPHSYWYNIFTSMIAFGLLALLLVKTAAEKSKILNFGFISFYMAIYVISISLAQVFSLFPGLSLRFFIFHLNCFVLVILLVNSLNTTKRFATVVESLLAGIALVGLYAIMQRIRGVPVNPAQTDLSVNVGMPGRVYSTMENPNNLGQVLIMILPFYFAVALGSSSFIKKFIMLGMALPPLAALALTYSRSSWIGFAASAFVFVLLINWRHVPLFILAGLAMVPFLPSTVYNRILTIWNPRDSSVSYRFLIYQTIEPVLEKYWVTGTGLGSDVFMKVVQNYPLHTRVIPPHTHNLYIQVWIETGLIGMLSFVSFLASMIKKGVKTIKEQVKAQGDKYLKYGIIAGVSSLTGILVVGAGEYVWYYPRVMVIFWIVVGLLLASLNLAGDITKTEDN